MAFRRAHSEARHAYDAVAYHPVPTLRETSAPTSRREQNAVSAGAALGVNDRTIANRLRAAERALGTPIAARRAQVEVALRVCRLLDQPRR